LFDGQLDERLLVGFQCALLYTTLEGQRRIRVHNLSMPATSSVSQVFRNADLDTAMNFFAKAACVEVTATSVKTVRDQLQDRCCKILGAYRQSYPSRDLGMQMVMPESYKVYPVMTLGLLKTLALRKTSDVPVDLRVACMRWLRAMPISESITFLYPRVAAVHTLPETAGVLDPKTKAYTVMPPLTRASYAYLDPTGIYMIETTRWLYMWIGSTVPGTLLEEVFGVSSLSQLDVTMTELPVLENNRSGQVRGCVRAFRERRSGRYLPLRLCRSRLDPWEVIVANVLTEDENCGDPSYVNFLLTVHRQVMSTVVQQHQAATSQSTHVTPRYLQPY